MNRIPLFLFGLLAAAVARPAGAQPIDLSHGGPVDVTADSGLEYDQQHMTVTARGNARAVRGDVTVIADQLIAHLRKKRGAPFEGHSPAPSPADTGSNEIYRLEALGNVHIFTPTDRVDGADHGVYDIDQSVLVLTGPHLKLTTPQQVMTARDAMEYWSARHMAVGRGDAVVTTSDGRRIAADTLVGYTAEGGQAAGQTGGQGSAGGSAGGGKAAPAKTGSNMGTGKLQRADAFGHVVVRTQTETVTGDRGVYVPDTGIARLVGNVHITRGMNQLNGAEAVVNMKTGVSRLTERPGARVEGLVMPNQNEPAQDSGAKDAVQPGKKARKTP